MKNYVYKIELFSGFYESYFFKQVKAENEKDAIIQAVSFCNDSDEEDTSKFLNETLGENWTVDTFWNEMELKFENQDGSVGTDLIWLKEVEFDLDRY